MSHKFYGLLIILSRIPRAFESTLYDASFIVLDYGTRNFISLQKSAPLNPNLI